MFETGEEEFLKLGLNGEPIQVDMALLIVN